MEKKLLVLGMAAMMAAGAANAELQAFKVNGETVSVAQQKALYNSAVAQGQPAGAELERQVKNVLTQQTVLLQEAKKAKLDRNSDVKQAIEAARNQVLINAVLRDWAKKNPVKDEDVRKAYEAEKAAYGPTEYQVRHILVKTEDQAKNIISRLNKGADFDKLVALPGVGRKTANVVLNVAFGHPTIPVDTHIFRVSNRTGLAKGKTPDEIETKLEKIIPDAYKHEAHHWLLLHGRYCCKARSPECERCPVAQWCNAPEKKKRLADFGSPSKSE